MGDEDVGSEVQLLIRPEAARVGKIDLNRIELEVTGRSFRGMHWQLDGRHESGMMLTFIFSAAVDLPGLGETVTLSLNPEALTLLGDAR